MSGNHLHEALETNDDIGLVGPRIPKSGLHRLAAIRRAKGVSCYDLARQLGITVEEVRRQEEASDLPISTLNQWAAALGVPVTELIVEPEEWLHDTRLAKAQAERLLRLAAKLRDHSRRRSVQRLAQTFVDQLQEIHSALSPPANGDGRRVQPSATLGHRANGESGGRKA